MYPKTKYNREEFSKFIREFKITRPINKIVLHHTWRPTEKQWLKTGGEIRMKNLEHYYKNTKGWPGAPHLFAGPDGIFNLFDINRRGVHAGKGNRGSIALEMVGNFDLFAPKGEVKENAIHVLKTLILKFKLGRKDIYLHRYYSRWKTCPGLRVGRKWINKEITWPNDK